MIILQHKQNLKQYNPNSVLTMPFTTLWRQVTSTWEESLTPMISIVTRSKRQSAKETRAKSLYCNLVPPSSSLIFWEFWFFHSAQDFLWFLVLFSNLKLVVVSPKDLSRLKMVCSGWSLQNQRLDWKRPISMVAFLTNSKSLSTPVKKRCLLWAISIGYTLTFRAGNWIPISPKAM